MCNKVHKEPKNKFRKIPESGTGWKLFRKHQDKIYGVFSGPYRGNLFEGVSWIDDLGYYQVKTKVEEYGFCFFPTKSQAIKAVTRLRKVRGAQVCALEIEYSHGIGSFLSSEMDSIVRRFCIAKRFKIKEGQI